MKSFIWDANYITGLDDVDEQHQYLVGFINRYGQLIAENSLSPEDVHVALSELADYAVFHFKEEEALMALYNIDQRHIEPHQKLHRNFISDISSMRSLIDLEDGKASEQLLDFLIHWLAYHILGSDQNMARQIEAIKKGMSPTQAYEANERKRDSSTEPLLNALNGLFEQVSARNKLLVTLNRSLEEKVASRTKELSDANRQLEELSFTDSLTKLPNRRRAIRTLRQYWETEMPLVCIMIDADHFKTINDTYGHDAGDAVLKQLALTLRDSFRNDDIVCRLGGDEFLVLCPETSLAGGMIIAQKTLDKVKALRVETGGEPWQGSISVGVAYRTTAHLNYESLIKTADRSVYQAKLEGRNRVVCIQA
ncbi:GGDEF domain-containing protein [Vibrio sp. SCSIO 43136]|uniref:sensor domain-containing diguanylate cyclase n=1 Tax=Vibrio sp. SCSIO 43136 TaxID=2819101 RepID=UPI00207597F3|nr:GGDEF domain-containing protein [Vibrio sp. SCSIO 43136]USD64013.1 GGDEF domain-containing protein [Vibrio sp. SCSIO 43136]